MKTLIKLTVSMMAMALVACSGGGGGGGTGGKGGGGNGGGGTDQTPASLYAGYEFSTVQSPLPISGVSTDFNTNQTLLGSKALMDVKNASTYHLNMLVGDPDCVNSIVGMMVNPNAAAMMGKTYSMVMIKSNNNSTNDPTHAVLTFQTAVVSGVTQETVSFAALKSTATVTNFDVTTDTTSISGSNGGGALDELSLEHNNWSCSNGVSTYQAGGGTTWQIIANDSVVLVKTQLGSVYMGFENSVALSNATSLSGKTMDSFSMLFAGADDYNNCPTSSTCGSRPNVDALGTNSGSIFSGSPVAMLMPQVGDQSPQVKAVVLSSTSAKFMVVQGTGNMMGATGANNGRIVGIGAQIGTQFMTLFSHQYQETHSSNAIFNGLGAMMVTLSPE